MKRFPRLSACLWLIGLGLYSGCESKQQLQQSPSSPPPMFQERPLEPVRTGEQTGREASVQTAALDTPAMDANAPEGAARHDDSESPPIAGDRVRTHAVQRGETLWSIAQHYYGNGRDWRKIHAANRNRIQNPRDVPVGTKLIIP